MAYGYSYKPPKIAPYGGLRPEGFTSLAQSVPAGWGNMLAQYYPNWAAPTTSPYTGGTGVGTGYMQGQNPPNSPPYTGSTGQSTSGAYGTGDSQNTSGTPGVPHGGGNPGGGSGAGGAASGNPWATDPILLKQMALDAQMVKDAESGALAQRKTALINYGDPTLAGSVLKGDVNTASAAKGNQFSTLAQLLNQYTQGNSHMNENLSDHNLFFSSTRVNDLVNSGKAYEGQKYGAAGQVQGLLGSIANALLQARYQAQQNDITAEENAYNRYLQSLLAQQQGGPGPGPGPGPDGGPPPGGGPTPTTTNLYDPDGNVIYSGSPYGGTYKPGSVSPLTGSTAIGTGYNPYGKKRSS